jgi:preprotein translocase subunit SecG
MVLLVLVQSKGKGLTSSVATGSFYGSRRGLEKLVFILTIGIAAFLVANSLLII